MRERFIKVDKDKEDNVQSLGKMSEPSKGLGDNQGKKDKR